MGINSRQMRNQILLSVLLSVTIMVDYISTTFLFMRGELIELNPLLSNLVGTEWFFMIKLITVGLTISLGLSKNKLAQPAIMLGLIIYVPLSFYHLFLWVV